MPDPIVPDARPAASSAAQPDAAVPALDSLSEAQLHAWKMTGDVPAPESTDPDPTSTAASSAAPAVEDPPASTDAHVEPASEAGTPRADPRATENRVPELLADRSRERARADKAERALAELRARSAPPAPAAQPAASAPAPAGLVKPDPDAFPYGTSDPDYLEALADYKVEARFVQERTTWQTREQEQQRAQQEEAAVAAFETRAAAARERHPDFDAVALQAPTEIPQGSAADVLILEHEHGAEILYHLQQPANAAERRRILALPPLPQIAALIRLGDRLTTPPAASSTTAPPPPQTLTTRGAPGDPVARALADGDEGTGAYIRAMNARELARLKR